jgi:hypothetical protein
MRRPAAHLYTLGTLLLSLLWLPAFAQTDQHHQQVHSHPVFLAIDQATERGSISEEEALLQKFRFAFAPDRVDTEFLTEDTGPVKCMNPEYRYFLENRAQLSPSVVREIEEFTDRPNTEHTQTYLSPSGNFIIHYETEGQDAVPPDDTNNSGIPDYVELTAFAADSSYRYQVEQAGFADFRKTNPYEIFYRDFNFYGTTTQSGSTTFIRIHSNFEGFPPNSHPEGDVTGALFVTVAHEVKHAIQFETNRWQGDAGTFDWIEMDAVLMEEVVFPDVNDYYNYIKTSFDSDQPGPQSIFGNPANPTPGAYWHMTWMLYFYETLGIGFWVDVWEQFIEDRNKLFFTAMTNTLTESGLNLRREHIRNHLWHMASGSEFNRPGFGFEDTQNYPNPNFILSELEFVADVVEGFTLRPFGAHYVRAAVPALAEGQPQFVLNATVPGVGLGVVGYFRDGSIRTEIAVNPDNGSLTLQTAWNWSELDRISVAVVNTNTSGFENADYTLEMNSTMPDDDFILQNYPNPFNNSTRITFAITESKPVKLEVYDSIGRRVATLVDSQLESGFHTINFDAAGLATGMYIYRITTGELTRSKKMLLIK